MSDGHEGKWARIRERTPALLATTYLNCGFSGPLSLDVAEAMHRRIDLELQSGPVSRPVQDDKVATMTRVRALAARALGADVDEIAVTGNTTEGVNIAVNGVALQPGDRVVTTSIEHGSGVVPAYWARDRRGAELAIVRVVAGDGPGAIIEQFDQALGDRAALVILSEIAYSTGQLLPLRQITELAHARGATVVADGAQTFGHLPIDVHALGVDAYAVPSHKWLCGPDGLGVLYVRRDRIADLDPVKVSGRAAAEFDTLGAFTYDREHVTKFELSTMSTPAAAGMAVAMEQYLDHGPQAVWDRVRALTRYAEQRFESLPGVEVISPRTDDARSGLFLFRPGGLDPAALAGYLWGEHRIVCRSVQESGAVRLSLHVYTLESEIDLTADAVEHALRHGIPQAYIDELAMPHAMEP